MPLYDSAGAIHIHSNLSDGTGAMPEIIRQAQQAQLDYFIVTDHEHLEAREQGYEGWRGDTLCLIGEEITPRFHNHYLAFNIRKPIRGRGNWRRPQAFIDETRRQGGIGFIAHPIGEDYPLRVMAHPWLDWDVSGFTGIEVWAYMHDWARNLKLRSLGQALKDPDALLNGPHPKALERWDAIGKKRPVAAIGTLDIHAKNAPGLPCAKIFPYQHAFQTIRTHVLTQDPLARNDPFEAGRQVYDALEKGARVYRARRVRRQQRFSVPGAEKRPDGGAYGRRDAAFERFGAVCEDAGAVRGRAAAGRRADCADGREEDRIRGGDARASTGWRRGSRGVRGSTPTPSMSARRSFKRSRKKRKIVR